jgi:hypothetical protein
MICDLCKENTPFICIDPRFLNWCMLCVSTYGVEGGFMAVGSPDSGRLSHAWLGQDNPQLREIAWRMEFDNA